MIPQILQKLQVDQATVLVVVPYWPTQAWYTKMVQMTQGCPFFIEPNDKNLLLPNKPKTKHPLSKQLTLIIGVMSGISSSVKDTVTKP